MNPFTGHNISLGKEKTIGDSVMLLSDSNLWKSIKNTVELFYPGSPKENANYSVVDLGCLEGGYSVEFARMGFNTTGIEVRQDNIDKCNYVKQQIGLDNLKFVKDDVRNLKNHGRFDITLCYGLLYHLENPVAYLKTICENTNKLLVLHTHYANEHDFRYSLGVLNNLYRPFEKRIKPLYTKRNFKLGRLTSHEGYRGRWYKEWNAGTPENKVSKMLWASHGNDKSFWLLKRDLLKALYAVGFDHVFEQTNFTGDLAADNYVEYNDRSMIVAFKK